MARFVPTGSDQADHLHLTRAQPHGGGAGRSATFAGAAAAPRRAASAAPAAVSWTAAAFSSPSAAQARPRRIRARAASYGACWDDQDRQASSKVAAASAAAPRRARRHRPPTAPRPSSPRRAAQRQPGQLLGRLGSAGGVIHREPDLDGDREQPGPPQGVHGHQRGTPQSRDRGLGMLLIETQPRESDDRVVTGCLRRAARARRPVAPGAAARGPDCAGRRPPGHCPRPAGRSPRPTRPRRGSRDRRDRAGRRRRRRAVLRPPVARRADDEPLDRTSELPGHRAPGALGSRRHDDPTPLGWVGRCVGASSGRPGVTSPAAARGPTALRRSR
jgi:hypothetical protein